MTIFDPLAANRQALSPSYPLPANRYPEFNKIIDNVPNAGGISDSLHIPPGPGYAIKVKDYTDTHED